MNSGTKWYREFTLNGVDGTQYDEIEFWIATVSYTQNDNVEQYVKLNIFEQTSANAQVSNTFKTYYIKLGSEPYRVIMPVASTSANQRRL